MRASEHINDLAAALAKAQGAFRNPERNRDVEVATKAKGDRPAGKYTFSYATFDAILEMARPILSENGLAYIQSPSTHDGNVFVTTRIAHASGQWVEDEIGARLGGDDGPQQIGSLITYLKRYSLCSMLGIAAEEDDDGNAASGNTASAKEREPMPTCPKCNSPKGVIKGKEEYGGGWVCFAKKGGCGHKWHDAPTEQPKSNGKPTDESKRSLALKAIKEATAIEKVKTYALSFYDRKATGGEFSDEDKLAVLMAAITRLGDEDIARPHPDEAAVAYNELGEKKRELQAIHH